MNMQDFNDEKYRNSSRHLKTTQQSDSYRGTGVYLTLDSQNFRDDPEDYHFPVKSPDELIPKFFHDLDMKTSNRGNEIPLPIKIASTPTIYSPDDDIDRYRSDSLSENRVQTEQDQSVNATPSNFRRKYRRSFTNKGDKTPQHAQDKEDFQGKEDFLGMVDRSYKQKKGVIDNFAAALVARVKVKGAFNNAAENRVFDASNQELNLINDKAFIVNHKEIEKKQRVIRSQRKKGGRLRQILEKHGIISHDLRKRREQANKINRNASAMQNISNKFANCKESLRDFGLGLVESLRRGRDRMKESFGSLYIHPQSRFRLCWDFLAMMFIFYDLVYIPFIICFDVPTTLGTFVFDAFKDIFFMVDVPLNFKTGYMEDGALITDPTLIRKNYLRGWFTIDFLTSIPITLIFDLLYQDDSYGSSVRAIRLIRFIRFVRIARVFKAIKLQRLFATMEEFFYSSVFNGIKGLIGLFFTILILAHWVACIWYLVGSIVLDSTGQSWLTHYDISEADNSDKYIASMYWAIATMLTVGYGDISPISTPERLYNIIVMLMGCAIFGYSMNSIGILVQSIQAGVSRTRQMYYNLSKYMDQKKVSKNMRSKVIHYLDYMIEAQKHGKMAEDQLFSILSDNIKIELKKDINGQVLRENVLLQKNFGNKFLSILSNSLEEKIFSPGEVIFDEMDKTCHMYFIGTGTVDLYYSDCNVILKKLERESHFGEIAFFTGKSRTAAARSSTFSDIFFIRRDSFLTLVEDYSGDKEMFHLIKDNISLYNTFETVAVTCLLCNNEGHVARDCHRVHYIPDKEKIIKKHHNEIVAFCKNFKRERSRNHFHAKRRVKEIATRAREYCDGHTNQIQKFLHDSFETSFFKGAVETKSITDQQGIFKMPARSKTDTSLPAVPDEPKYQKTDKNIATSIEEGEIDGGITDRAKKSHGFHIKTMSRNKKMKLMLNSRLRMKVIDKRGKKNQAEIEEEFEENEVTEIEGNQNYLAPGPTLQIPRRSPSRNFTVVQMGKMEKDMNDNNYLFGVVDLQGLNSEIIRPKLIPLEMVANFSIYFPHNNISKILMDLKNKKQGKKDSVASEKMEAIFKRAKNESLDDKRRGSVSPFGRGRGSVDDKRRGSISPFSRGRINSGDEKKRGNLSPDVGSRRKSLFVWGAKNQSARDSVSEQRESRVATNADEETSIVKNNLIKLT